MSSWHNQIKGELLDLNERTQKLEAFLLTDEAQQLSDEDLQLLRNQLQHMLRYRKVLRTRVGRLSE